MQRKGVPVQLPLYHVNQEKHMFTSATDLPANALTDTALHRRSWPEIHFFPTTLERPRFHQSVPANCRELRKDPSIYLFSVRMALCFNIYQGGTLLLPLITINCAHESARMFSGVTIFCLSAGQSGGPGKETNLPHHHS